MTEHENVLLTKKHILICLGEELLKLDDIYKTELVYIKENFLGNVLTCSDKIADFAKSTDLQNIMIYMIGDIDQIKEIVGNTVYYVIQELSYNYKDSDKLISVGQVPINIHNAGVYFREFFYPENTDYFDKIESEHEFQSLTESNKPGKAFRSGIYLSKVEKVNDELHYNLLRCSSNLSGPTDNFNKTDTEIIENLNKLHPHFFEEVTDFNHVLAQIYENKTITNIINGKTMERKAKIKAHSDKTKDMPRNGLIAFCTFYKDCHKFKKSKSLLHDYVYNNKTSVLTRLHFKIKNETAVAHGLEKEFSVTLYPNSVFIIPLSTNRLYTHEIRPSILSIDKIPTRLGYVVRCSKTRAMFKDGQVYLNSDDKLEEATIEGVEVLKNVYVDENITDEIITYDKFNFSLNSGDYIKPTL